MLSGVCPSMFSMPASAPWSIRRLITTFFPRLPQHEPCGSSPPCTSCASSAVAICSGVLPATSLEWIWAPCFSRRSAVFSELNQAARCSGGRTGKISRFGLSPMVEQDFGDIVHILLPPRGAAVCYRSYPVQRFLHRVQVLNVWHEPDFADSDRTS